MLNNLSKIFGRFEPRAIQKGKMATLAKVSFQPHALNRPLFVELERPKTLMYVENLFHGVLSNSTGGCINGGCINGEGKCRPEIATIDLLGFMLRFAETTFK